MQAEDMSIYWNQHKGQYETNNYNYYKQDNTFTRTADQRSRYSETTAYQEEEAEEVDENAVKMGSWLGTFFLLLIPVVNLIVLIKMAISCKSASKKSFARATLFMGLICITVVLVFIALTCDKIDYTVYIDKVMALVSKITGVAKRFI